MEWLGKYFELHPADKLKSDYDRMCAEGENGENLIAALRGLSQETKTRTASKTAGRKARAHRCR